LAFDDPFLCFDPPSDFYGHENFCLSGSALVDLLQADQSLYPSFLPDAQGSEWSACQSYRLEPETGDGFLAWDSDLGTILPGRECHADVSFAVDGDFDHSIDSLSPFDTLLIQPLPSPNTSDPAASLRSGTLPPPLSPSSNSDTAKQNDLQHPGAPPTRIDSPQPATSVAVSQPLYRALPSALPFRCSTCLLTFASNARLIRHADTHKKYACEVDGCGKNFTLDKDLRRHLRTVHADLAAVPLQLYSCDCGRYKTRRKDHFKRHQANHRKRNMRRPLGVEELPLA
jgi:hypothetical protein